jgi:hypothetical protein
MMPGYPDPSTVIITDIEVYPTDVDMRGGLIFRTLYNHAESRLEMAVMDGDGRRVIANRIVFEQAPPNPPGQDPNAAGARPYVDQPPAVADVVPLHVYNGTTASEGVSP